MIAQRALALSAGPLVWRSLAVLASAIAVAAQLAMPVQLPVPELFVTPQPDTARHAGLPPRPATLYPAIAEHPLFSPTRKPYVAPHPPTPAAVAEGSTLRDYLLLGTVIAGNTRIALLKQPGNHQTIRATPGETIAGWKLREITPDALQFEDAAARFTLHLPNPRWPHQ